MDSSEVTCMILLGVLLLLSVFFSSAKTAFTTVNKLRIRSLAEEENKRAKLVNDLLESPTKMQNTLLIGNLILNIAISSLATSLAIDHFKPVGIVVTIAFLIFFMLVFARMIPNTLAEINSEKFTLKYAGLLFLIIRIMAPLTFLITKISSLFLKLFHANNMEKASVITEDELRSIVEVSHEEGVIEMDEKQMITNVVDFGDSMAKDVMVPRIDMVFAEISLSYDELVELFSEDKYTRMPVYSESRDNVLGIVNLKDIFFYQGSKEEFHIKDVMREPYFTYEYKKTTELLKEMRKNYVSLAIVIDEYGTTTGLVTLEDLLEEIVGEIRDEYDADEEDSIRKISDTEYIADGNTNLDEINEAIGLDLESDDYDSIAGHMIYLLDHLPEVGESITDGNVVYTADSVTKNRIEKVHIVLLPEDNASVFDDVSLVNTDGASSKDKSSADDYSID
ncbi:hemolysin family protein [Anaerocolumna xylanovorans]|uniref:Hemolysin, contains CBS domains n=1 Tax=Anaerocolumna xylanovorans DSM 12503 TaxID=1121345 RepID=A0A1M7Y471_9FIRM|nr:hemolysin family protein [Anaerocolumna xylanovorans]SHO47011.1 Hemolysin, contains CBS domains [Anaerocolumna xylanovorans DSM 12503]